MSQALPLFPNICLSMKERGSEANYYWYVCILLSCSGVGFQSPPFHGFVNVSLQIWLVKNGSVPADVTVTLSNDGEGE